MATEKRDPKPENETKKLPFFATDVQDKPMTARTGIRAGMEQRQKAGGG